MSGYCDECGNTLCVCDLVSYSPNIARHELRALAKKYHDFTWAAQNGEVEGPQDLVDDTEKAWLAGFIAGRDASANVLSEYIDSSFPFVEQAWEDIQSLGEPEEVE
jgi:hypothetical protein